MNAWTSVSRHREPSAAAADADRPRAPSFGRDAVTASDLRDRRHRSLVGAVVGDRERRRRYLDLKVGDGAEPLPGQTVKVHYNGWLDDFGDAGRKFDSSLDRGKPLAFAVGTGRVIKGAGPAREAKCVFETRLLCAEQARC